MATIYYNESTGNEEKPLRMMWEMEGKKVKAQGAAEKGKRKKKLIGEGRVFGTSLNRTSGYRPCHDWQNDKKSSLTGQSGTH
jgi:hypothetical protein